MDGRQARRPGHNHPVNYRERHKKTVACGHCRDIIGEVHDAAVVSSTWTD
jgi:hypothetical protein